MRLLLAGLLLGQISCPPIPIPPPEPSPTASQTPVIEPTASPSPSSTPTPTPEPTALATPSPAPSVGVCNLPPMPNCGSRCCTSGGPNPFEGLISEAQDEVARRHPEMFRANGSLLVDDMTYTRILARTVTEINGVCTARGGSGSISADEIGVKDSNGRSINVDVVRGTDSTPWVGPVWTCRPASF